MRTERTANLALADHAAERARWAATLAAAPARRPAPTNPAYSPVAGLAMLATVGYPIVVLFSRFIGA